MIGPLEPFRIKIVEPIKLISKQEREKSIRAAGFNVFKLPAEKIFIDHIPQSQFPGQAFAVALYRESGIRAVEIGSLMFSSKNPQTGRWTYPKLELLRLTISRRVYSALHLQYVAESVIAIGKKREHLKGLKLVYETPFLRHFTAVLQGIR
jgi:tryptophanase